MWVFICQCCSKQKQSLLPLYWNWFAIKSFIRLLSSSYWTTPQSFLCSASVSVQEAEVLDRKTNNGSVWRLPFADKRKIEYNEVRGQRLLGDTCIALKPPTAKDIGLSSIGSDGGARKSPHCHLRILIFDPILYCPRSHLSLSSHHPVIPLSPSHF